MSVLKKKKSKLNHITILTNPGHKGKRKKNALSKYIKIHVSIKTFRTLKAHTNTNYIEIFRSRKVNVMDIANCNLHPVFQIFIALELQ